MAKQWYYVLLFSLVFNSIFASDDEGCKGCGCLFRRRRSPQTTVQPTTNEMDPYAAATNAQASPPSVSGPSLYETAAGASLDMETELPAPEDINRVLELWFRGPVKSNPLAIAAIKEVADQLHIPYEISGLLAKHRRPFVRLRFTEGDPEAIERHFSVVLTNKGNINGISFKEFNWAPTETRLKKNRAR